MKMKWYGVTKKIIPQSIYKIDRTIITIANIIKIMKMLTKQKLCAVSDWNFVQNHAKHNHIFYDLTDCVSIYAKYTKLL